LLCCGIFAQAQSLNNFNDVRQLGVLLNPAHIGKADAKGELAGHYQMTSVDYETTNTESGQREHIFTQHDASARYTHYITLKNAAILQIGMAASTRWNSLEEFKNWGINAAYTQYFNGKNIISVGASAFLQNDITAINHLYFRESGNGLDWCGNGAYYNNKIRGQMVSSNLYSRINIGVETKHIFNKNADISLGFVANTINTPDVIYRIDRNAVLAYKALFNYKIILKSEFMVSPKIGFAPMILFSSFGEPINEITTTSEKSYILSNDFRFKNKHNDEWRIGIIQPIYDYHNLLSGQNMAFSARYSKAKTSVGVTCFPSYPLSIQTNFQCTF
jgi:hypothetical protein